LAIGSFGDFGIVDLGAQLRVAPACGLQVRRTLERPQFLGACQKIVQPFRVGHRSFFR
jgi:hypothetical protein